MFLIGVLCCEIVFSSYWKICKIELRPYTSTASIYIAEISLNVMLDYSKQTNKAYIVSEIITELWSKKKSDNFKTFLLHPLIWDGLLFYTEYNIKTCFNRYMFISFVIHVLWLALFSWVPIFVDWTNLTHSWGLKFVSIVFSFIIHKENRYFVGTGIRGSDLPRKPRKLVPHEN